MMLLMKKATEFDHIIKNGAYTDAGCSTNSSGTGI